MTIWESRLLYVFAILLELPSSRLKEHIEEQTQFIQFSGHRQIEQPLVDMSQCFTMLCLLHMRCLGSRKAVSVCHYHLSPTQKPCVYAEASLISMAELKAVGCVTRETSDAYGISTTLSKA